MNTSNAICPACSSTSVVTFLDMPDMPTYVNFLWKSTDEALACERGDIVLGFCHECGLISNVAFDESKLVYREGYENSLHFSDVFQRYAEELADDLIKRFELKNKTIIEIGCGRGDFLVSLCERGGNKGIGFDPSHTTPPDGAKLEGLEFVRDFYGEAYADRHADFICSRHTLEHVQNPFDMLTPLRKSIGERATNVFFEVPNGHYTLKNFFIWDVIYEHTSYFTAPALERIFRQAGFDVIKTYETFGGQYLCIEATPTEANKKVQDAKSDIKRIEDDIATFRTHYKTYIQEWRSTLDGLQKDGKRVVLWGAGSKGVTFLNLLDGARRIQRVVDVNPNKHGMHIAGAGQEIVPPQALVESPPDAIIVANPIYKAEITTIVDDLGLSCEFFYL